MTGSLLQAIRKDATAYITSGGFEEDISLTTPTGFSVSTKGLATDHSIILDTDGGHTIARNAHINVSEDELVSLSYPVRVNGEIDLKDHLVEFNVSGGFLKKYIVRESMPSQTFGLIVCVLGDYE